MIAPSSARRFTLFGEIVETSFDFGLELATSEGPLDLTFQREIGHRPSDWKGKVLYHDAESPSESTIFLRVGERTELLSFADISDFRFNEKSIECFSRSTRFDYLVTIQFLGYVMAYWLERKGIIALHGSAVSTPNGTVGFLAPKGVGKSTIAATLVRVGHDFVTDDILAVRSKDDSVFVSPSYPHLRLEPDGLTHFFGSDANAFQLVHPAFDKRRVPLDSMGGRMVEGPQSVAALVVLERGGESQTEVELTQLSPSETMKELLRHSFLANMVQRCPWRVERLAVLAEVTKRLPMFRASIPPFKENVEQAAESLLASIFES